MNDILHLDLRDKPRVIDFLVEVAPYADGDARQSAEEWVKRYHDGERVPTDKLAEVARQVALGSWSARCAVARYAAHEGAGEEWEGVLKMVRASTAHLMSRSQKKMKTHTLAELLEHPDIGVALRDEEMQEIAHARIVWREQVWKDKKSALAGLMKEGDKELQAYTKRLRSLRDVAEGLPLVLQDEVFSKLRHYEDRIMFGRERVPVEILDEEIKYYTEQREISPLEG